MRQGGSGWSAHDVRHTRRMAHKWLPGEYFTGSQGAKATYKRREQAPHASAWNNTRFLFIAPSGWHDNHKRGKYPVTASDNVQCIEITGETSSVSITNGVPGITGLGVWLNDDSGITLDCMSLRGNSGISHTTLNEELSAQVAEFISYDLIIVEYGINALTSSQKDYSKYTGYMENVIRTLRRCHPQADILLMGIGDRGQKRGGLYTRCPHAATWLMRNGMPPGTPVYCSGTHAKPWVAKTQLWHGGTTASSTPTTFTSTIRAAKCLARNWPMPQ